MNEINYPQNNFSRSGQKGLAGRVGSELAFESRDVGKMQSRREKGYRQKYEYSKLSSDKGGGQSVCLEAWGGKGGRPEKGILIKLGRESGSPGGQHKEVRFYPIISER